MGAGRFRGRFPRILEGARMKQLRFTFILTTLLIMLLIFLFSSQNAEKSTELSNSVGYQISSLTIRDFDQLPPVEQKIYVVSIDHIVRKYAHASEFLLLALSLSAMFLSFLWRRKMDWLCFLLGWVFTLLYAVTDEIHQLFVPGRACMATDVLIDGAGAALGILLFCLIYFLIRPLIFPSIKA